MGKDDLIDDFVKVLKRLWSKTATATSNGFMSSADKNKLDALPPAVLLDTTWSYSVWCTKLSKHSGCVVVYLYDNSDVDNEIFGCQDYLVGTASVSENNISLQVSCYDGRARLSFRKTNGAWSKTNEEINNF